MAVGFLVVLDYSKNRPWIIAAVVLKIPRRFLQMFQTFKDLFTHFEIRNVFRPGGLLFWKSKNSSQNSINSEAK